MMSNLNLVAAGAGITVVPASMRGTHPDAIVAALYLFSQSNGAEAAPEAEMLLQRSRREGTVASRYVVSVIEAVTVLKRRGV